MIPLWYYFFLGCVVLLWAFSVPQDRNALRVLLAASLFGIALVMFVTSKISAPWKLVIPAANEILTISAMFHWARNRTGYWQMAFLSVAWVADVLCYVHLKSGHQLPFFYDHYETIIQVVAVGQLAACYDTIQFHFGRAYLWANRLFRVPAASNRAAVLHPESGSDV